MKNCIRCGEAAVFDVAEDDLLCPNCGWGQKTAIRMQMEELRGYNKTFYPRIIKLFALYLIGLPVCFFLVWLCIPNEIRNAVLLSKYGKVTRATVVETKYGYSHRKSRRSSESIPVYFNYIVYDGHRDAISTDGQPYQIGHTFEIMYYPKDPAFFSRSAQKGDSPISIFFHDISFLALFALVFTLVLSVGIFFYTWTTIQRLSKHKRLKLDLDSFELHV